MPTSIIINHGISGENHGGGGYIPPYFYHGRDNMSFIPSPPPPPNVLAKMLENVVEFYNNLL